MTAVVALGSAGGSPGVTTAAVALADRWPAPAGGGGRPHGRVVVEANPAGGVLAGRFGLADTHPGLAGLVAAASGGGGRQADRLWYFTQQLAGGLPAVVAPPAGQQAWGLIEAGAGELVGWLRRAGPVAATVDCGQLTPASPAETIARAADVVLVVARPVPGQLRAAARRLEQLKAGGGPPVALLLVGDRPYGPAEVAAALQVPVAGVLAADRRAAAGLAGEGLARRLVASPLLSTAARVAEELASRTAASRPVADTTERAVQDG